MESIIALVIAYIIMGGLIAIFILYCKWHFIRSAVESGTVRAIERILKDYTDLIEDIPPDCPPPVNNDFEKDLNDWVSFKK